MIVELNMGRVLTYIVCVVKFHFDFNNLVISPCF